MTRARGTKDLAARLRGEFLRDSEHMRSMWEMPIPLDIEMVQGKPRVDLGRAPRVLGH